DDELREYTGQFKEPARAQATALLYRHAVVRLPPTVLRGAYRRIRMETAGLMLFGTADHVQDARLMPGFEPYAPSMRLELVPGVGHFIVDERPELVLERARELFDA
ncbi:MAG TPA: hypothetical protein VFL56_06285, partial [Solirubrobacterales bacterium]|nr:hypothetical protein [Solirubrobacterales bacterium]